MFFSQARKKKPRTPPPDKARMLDVAGRSLPLTIRQTSSATRLTLRIEPGGKAIKLTVPLGLPERDVDDFLVRHQGWLMTRLARFPRSPLVAEGYSLQFRGVAHRIERTGKMRGLTEAVNIDGEAILRVSGEEPHLKRRLRDFLKEEARRDLSVLVERHCAVIGRKAKGIAMKDTTSRWGSCSQDGNLSFSWRIVMAPPVVIDYLAAHEVSHLREMNHGPAFWALCEKLCPQMDEAKRWLKRNGTLLHAIDFS